MKKTPAANPNTDGLIPTSQFIVSAAYRMVTWSRKLTILRRIMKVNLRNTALSRPPAVATASRMCPQFAIVSIWTGLASLPHDLASGTITLNKMPIGWSKSFFSYRPSRSDMTCSLPSKLRRHYDHVVAACLIARASGDGRGADRIQRPFPKAFRRVQFTLRECWPIPHRAPGRAGRCAGWPCARPLRRARRRPPRPRRRPPRA